MFGIKKTIQLYLFLSVLFGFDYTNSFALKDATFAMIYYHNTPNLFFISPIHLQRTFVTHGALLRPLTFNTNGIIKFVPNDLVILLEAFHFPWKRDT